jgi:hypothetical protein
MAGTRHERRVQDCYGMYRGMSTRPAAGIHREMGCGGEWVAGSQPVEPVRRRQKGQTTCKGGRVEKGRRFIMMFPLDCDLMMIDRAEYVEQNGNEAQI